MNKQNLNIEVQYFLTCPNYKKALANVREFIQRNKNDFDISFRETIVETIEDARRVKFRGSPTILVKGQDVEGVAENEFAALACRYYPDGVPTDEKIKSFVNNLTENN